jgi:hypothetical protein
MTKNKMFLFLALPKFIGVIVWGCWIFFYGLSDDLDRHDLGHGIAMCGL